MKSGRIARLRSFERVRVCLAVRVVAFFDVRPSRFPADAGGGAAQPAYFPRERYREVVVRLPRENSAQVLSAT